MGSPKKGNRAINILERPTEHWPSNLAIYSAIQILRLSYASRWVCPTVFLPGVSHAPFRARFIPIGGIFPLATPPYSYPICRSYSVLCTTYKVEWNSLQCGEGFALSMPRNSSDPERSQIFSEYRRVHNLLTIWDRNARSNRLFESKIQLCWEFYSMDHSKSPRNMWRLKKPAVLALNPQKCRCA